MAHNLAASLDQIKNTPAASPPPGIRPDYNNPANRNDLAIGVIIASIAITTLAGLIRVFSKVFCTGTARLEDYLGLASYPFFIAGTWVLTTILQSTGFFVHQWDLLVKDLEEFLYSYVLSTTLYCVAMLLAKAAILLEWTHIFIVRSSRNKFYWICYGLTMVNTALYIATIFVVTYACTPRERVWQRYLPGTCIDIEAFNLCITVFHLVFDLLMLLLPQTAIWKLSLTKKQKFGISIVFSVGALACIWATGRVFSAVNLIQSQDKTYGYSQYIMWGLAEVATAELVFCVPTFPILFRQPNFLRKFFSYLRSKMPFSSDSKLSRWQPRSDLETTPGSRCPWSDEGSDTALTELEPIRVRSRRLSDQRWDGRGLNYGGILITTDIDVRTEERQDSKRGRVQPKSYCQVTNNHQQS